jgi:hypothetical protein
MLNIDGHGLYLKKRIYVLVIYVPDQQGGTHFGKEYLENARIILRKMF